MESITKKPPGISKKLNAGVTHPTLSHLAFDNSIQANIISTVNTGKIIIANNAACKLLGYSEKELLTKSRAAIFKVNESFFKKMLKQSTAEGHSTALVTAVKKNGKPLSCEITSTVFLDEGGIEKAIYTIVDRSQTILNQKNIDTKNEKIVADNITLAKSKQKKIDTKKQKIVAGNIVLAISKQKKIDIKKEKIVAENIVLAISRQKNIDIKREKIVAANIILAQAKSDARLAVNNEWIKYIAKTSYDVMWDWDIVTGQIYVGDSIEEVFGYKVENNRVNFADFSRRLLPGERDVVERKLMKLLASGSKSWKDSYMLKRRDGSVAATTCRASIVRDEEGKAIHLIGNIQDVSRLLELEKKLNEQITIQEEDSEKFILAARLSFDVIWDWNLLSNEVFRGDGFEELFGYPIKNNKSNLADWRNNLHPDDKETVEKGLFDAIASSATSWEHTYRFVRADGSIAKIFDRASIIRHPDGKAYRMIGAIHDISKQKVLEERLEEEITLKEKQITEATAQARETERSNIGKELHDNVNQLLGASRLYLNMAKRGGDNTEMFLKRSSEYTLTAIEEIRKLTKGLTSDAIKTPGLCESIDNLIRDTMEVTPIKISTRLESFIELNVNDKFKLNVFRIVQEELNNIVKHAKATEVSLSLSQNKKAIKLTISDNGVGFDTTKKRNGTGIDNIKSRAAYYNTTAEFVSHPGQGSVLTVIFPVTDILLNKN